MLIPRQSARRFGFPGGFLAACAICLIVNANAEPIVKRGRSETTAALDDLISGNEGLRFRAIQTVLQERERAIEKLIHIVDPANANEFDDGARCSAAYLLGELRAGKAVPVLSAALVADRQRVEFPNLDRCGNPFLTALIEIGRPSIPEMLRNVGSSEDRRVRKQSLGVLLHTVGGKRRLIDVLAKAQERSKDPHVIRRLKEASDWAQAHYQEDEEPLY